MSNSFKRIVALICVALVTVVAGGGAWAEEGVSTSPSDIVLMPAETVQLAIAEPEWDHPAAVVTLAASLAAVELAAEENADIISIPDTLPEDLAEDVTVLEYTEVPVYVNGEDMGNAMKINDTTYVPVGQFCQAIGYQVEASWDQESGKAVFTGEGMELSMVDGEVYITANGRCFHTGEIYNCGGAMIVPIRELAVCFGLEALWNQEEQAVAIDASNVQPIVHGDEHYVEEDLYWLSRIIFAEAGNQPLDGMAGVGNVVLNRVADPTCPDTVYEVIFDNRYGVQFSVTENGTIYLEPTQEAVDVAKMCLEGYNPVGDSLFFVNPVIGSSSWFNNTRTYVATIGEHVFYA